MTIPCIQITQARKDYVASELGQLPSNSHSKFQGHHLPKDG